MSSNLVARSSNSIYRKRSKEEGVSFPPLLVEAQTPDSSMPSGKRPMGRKQAKEKLKKGGEPTNYNLIEKFLKSISSSSPVPPIPIKLPYWGHLCFFLTPAVPQYLSLFLVATNILLISLQRKGEIQLP